MSYLFPLSFMSNTFAMTALLVGLGLAGKSTMAADVGIVQGATLALFYAFSANARNMILGRSWRISMRAILMARLLLLAPLGIASFYLSVYVADASGPLALALTLRRCVEWISELHLGEIELHGRRECASRFIVLQSVLIFLALGWVLMDAPMPLAGLFLWAILPLLMSVGFIRQHLMARGQFQEAWPQMFPHLGSTAMIGITVYVFRLLILLIVGKETAGELYAAFAIGSVMGSVFANALGPSLVLHEDRSGEARFPAALKVSLCLWLVAGAVLFLAAEVAAGSLEWTGKSSFFWGATGLSMIGGVVMVFAQRIRLRLLQAEEDGDVYGPDVLMNILIVASVPYLYYLAGKDALMSLYLFNSILALLFYVSSKSQIALSEHRLGVPVERWRKGIVFLLFLPLFFQLTGNIFRDPAWLFDSEGILKRVPLPLSVFVCFVGIPLLGGYKRAYLSLGAMFLSFVLMLMSAVISTQGHIAEEQGKVLLLLQFILPMSALVLGQVYEAGERNSVLLEKVCLYVLSILVPVQLLLTWLQGHVLLSPYFYLFSIYQHIQYVPVIFASGYLIALYSLWQSPRYRKILLFLAPWMGVYAAASASLVALVALSGGVVGFAVYRWKCGSDKWPRVVALLVILTSGVYLTLLATTFSRNTALVSQKFAFLHEELAPNMDVRWHYWKYYAGNIVNDSNAFLFGHATRPDRSLYPSAHNYYLDFVYNFGMLAFLPLLAIIGYTLLMVYRRWQAILASSSLFGLTVVVLLLLLVDNSLKVGLRQPYPGIITFFLWAVLLSRLSKLDPMAQNHQKAWN